MTWFSPTVASRLRVPLGIVLLVCVVVPPLASRILTIRIYQATCFISLIVALPFSLLYLDAWEDRVRALPNARALLLLLPAMLAPCSGLVCFLNLDHRDSAACRQQVRSLQAETEPSLDKLRASRIRYATGIAKVQRQPLIVTCDLTYQDLPDLASAKLADHWYEIALGKIGKDLDYIPLNSPLEFTPHSVVLIAGSYRASGQKIQLDNGWVPELRQQVIIFAVNLDSMAIVWRSENLYGGPARSPAHTPGVQYFSELRGPEVKRSEIDMNITDKIPWTTQ